MKSSVSLLAALIILALPAAPISAQVCGDANSDALVNISDMAYLFNYLGSGGPPPADSTLADVDSRAGITVSDAIVLMKYMFQGGPPPTCNITGAYSFTASPDDTLFLPRMYGIPDAINHVALPLSIHVEPDVLGFYMAFLQNTAGGAFTLDSTSEEVGFHSFGWDYTNRDTCMALSTDYTGTVFDTSVVVFKLHFGRKAPGTVDIVPQIVDLPHPRRTAIERSGDLFVPTIAYVNLPVPPDTLIASPTVLTFDAVYGYPEVDTLVVSFTSDQSPVEFLLTPDQSWIQILNSYESPWLTPALCSVSVDLSGLPGGLHTGQIAILPSDPTIELPVSAVEVNLNIQPATDTLFVSTDSLAFEVVAGVPSAPIHYIDFTHSLNPVNFNLLPGHTWTELAVPGSGSWSSPTTVGLTVDHSGLPVGSYAGEFLIQAPQGTFVEHNPIRLYLTVSGATTPGDLNCDGEISITDLTLFIAYMFRGGAPLVPCL